MSTDFFDFILKYDGVIRFFHIFGSIIAIGAVIVGDLAAVRIKLKPENAFRMIKISSMLSLQIWIGLLLISISGLLMFLPRQGLVDYSIFQFKMILVFVIFLNGIFLNLYISPKFNEIVPEWSQNTAKVKKFTKIAGMASIISFLTWWGVIILMTVFY
ncbi:MAG TPA: hypothetical protein PKA60_03075 [Candidatus Paceibacterota bacterium]|nr:hypothetical protein [Candidatus Paceibacterota bacterium]